MSETMQCKPDHIADAGKMVEPVNAGAGCDLGRYRTGETPMVGDVVRWHGMPIAENEDTDPASELLDVGSVSVGLNSTHVRTGVWEYSNYVAARFDLISRPAPSPGQVTEGEDKDARIAELEAALSRTSAELMESKSNRAEAGKRITELKDERDWLHITTIGWFAKLGVCTPEEGFLKARHCLPACFEQVQKKPAPASPAESQEPVKGLGFPTEFAKGITAAYAEPSPASPQDNLDELQNYKHVHYPKPAAVNEKGGV